MKPTTSSNNINGSRTNHCAHRLAIVLAFAVSATSQHAAVQAGPLRIVTLTSRPAPGTADGVVFDSFGTFLANNFVYQGVVLNDLGQTAFRANLRGNGVGSVNRQGVWSEGSGSLSLVARTGSHAPGAPSNVNFNSPTGLELFTPVLNNAGQTAFYGGLTNGGRGLWVERSGSLTPVAISGDHAPGTPNGVLFSFDSLFEFLETPVLNDAGQTTFRSNVSGPGINASNKFGLWSEGSGSLQLVARLGTQAQGLPDGVNHGYMFSAGLNNSGQSVFFSFLSGSEVNNSNNHSLWTDGPGGPAMLARGGSQAPGMPSGVNFDRFSNTGSINSAGQIAFMAGLSSENSTFGQESLWFSDSGNLTPLAVHGMQAPGTPSGVTFEDIGYWPALNDAGQVLFGALLSGTGVNATNEQALYLSDALGNKTLVVRLGDQAPGTPAGTFFYADRDDVGSSVLNSAGQVASTGRLIGEGVNPSNDLGIWATDKTGALKLVARKGDTLQLGPGSTRVISDLSFVGSGGNSNGWPSAFNNLGQLAFWASFTDGTQGVFVTNAVANFTWKNLTKVHFFDADMTGADLTGADGRGAPGLNLSGVNTTNLIRPDGQITGLNLAAGEKLVAYPGVPIPVQVSGEFSIAPTATFDLTDNDLIVRATAETKDQLLAEIQAKITSAQNGLDANLITNWNGPGITSSTARTNNVAQGFDLTGLGVIRNSDLDTTTGVPGSAYTSFSGQPVTPDDVLVKYTYVGDANLSGAVTFDDYVGMDNAFFGLIPNLGWATGDINYDGLINFDDYSKVDQAFFFQAAPLTAAASGPEAVPEPTSMLLSLVFGGALSFAICRLRRRRPT